MAEDSNTTIEIDTTKQTVVSPAENWMTSKWRPLMALTYMGICIGDFFLFPILWPLLMHFDHLPITQWKPITMDQGGFFHLSMGAILGVSAWTRGQEKINKS